MSVLAWYCFTTSAKSAGAEADLRGCRLTCSEGVSEGLSEGVSEGLSEVVSEGALRQTSEDVSSPVTRISVITTSRNVGIAIIWK